MSTTLEQKNSILIKKDNYTIKGKKIFGTIEKPRVVFCETNRYIIVQAIDDKLGHTLAYANTRDLDYEKTSFNKKNINFVSELALLFSKKLKKEKIETITFDRNGKKYHGKIKVFCTILRKEGIIF